MYFSPLFFHLSPHSSPPSSSPLKDSEKRLHIFKHSDRAAIPPLLLDKELRYPLLLEVFLMMNMHLFVLSLDFRMPSLYLGHPLPPQQILFISIEKTLRFL